MNRLEQLKALTNEFYYDLANGSGNQLRTACEMIKSAGVISNCHCGSPLFKSLSEDSYESKLLTIEWYLGQLLYMYEKEQLFAVNSWLNCKEKFCDNL